MFSKRKKASGASNAPFRSLLRPLGIVGYDAVEPALLAALATEEPLLLVSDHGAAKSLLLCRLAEALGLQLRHYNASLLQFDDLAGFPIPDERGGIRYASGPGAIWGAEAVFFDEIGRCRPESANKLFAIVHERRIQGASLESLRYRWAATNPPVEAMDADRADDPYEGVERLDPALADRFAYVLPLPAFADLSDEDRAAVIRGTGERAAEGSALIVRELVHATRSLLEPVADDIGEAATSYVLALAPQLREAKIVLGGRRAAALRRNLVAVWAASVALGRSTGEHAFAATLFASIPDVVRRAVPRAALLAAHKAAWEQVALPATDPFRVVRAVADPVERALVAVTVPNLPAPSRGEALLDALAAMPKEDAEIVSWHLLPRLLEHPTVPAPAIETIAELVAEVASGGHAVHGYGSANEWVTKARSALAASGIDQETAEYLFAVTVRAHPPAVSLSGGRDDSWKQRVEHSLAISARCTHALGARAA